MSVSKLWYKDAAELCHKVDLARVRATSSCDAARVLDDNSFRKVATNKVSDFAYEVREVRELLVQIEQHLQWCEQDVERTFQSMKEQAND